MAEQEKIQYEITFQPNHRIIEVTLISNQPIDKGQSFTLAKWTPGSYFIRDYAKHIVSISALDCATNRAISLRKINDNTYVCDETVQQLELKYAVYANDPSIRGCYCDHDRVFINSPALFIRIVGKEKSPIEVTFKPHDRQADHQIATQLENQSDPLWGWGTYHAVDFDYLLDCPIAIAKMEITTFECEGVVHYIAFIGQFMGDTQRVTEDVAKICHVQADIFADKLPFDSYLFLLHVAEDNYGGLEHQNSSALICSRQCMPKGKEKTDKDYQLLLGLFSHEYFHAWHVKRIKPAAFMTLDLDTPVHTTLLWVFEGFTSYFDDLALVRSGVISKEDYFNLVLNNLARYSRAPGDRMQSLAESSFDAWTKFYAQNENTVNQGVSYYCKGAVVAFLLDCKLRLKHQEGISLCSVMQHLWQNYGKQGKGLQAEEILEYLETLGIEKDFLEGAILRSEALNIDQILRSFGLTIEKSPLASLDTKYPLSTNSNSPGNYYGWLVNAKVDHATILSVRSESPAAQAGLWAKDELIAFNGFKVNKQSFERLCKQFSANENIEITFFRDNVLKQTSLTVAEAPMEISHLSITEGLSQESRQRLSNWLNQPI